MVVLTIDASIVDYQYGNYFSFLNCLISYLCHRPFIPSLNAVITSECHQCCRPCYFYLMKLFTQLQHGEKTAGRQVLFSSHRPKNIPSILSSCLQSTKMWHLRSVLRIVMTQPRSASSTCLTSNSSYFYSLATTKESVLTAS